MLIPFLYKMHLFRFKNSDVIFLKNNWPINLPTAIIHADLFIDNILFIQKRGAPKEHPNFAFSYY